MSPSDPLPDGARRDHAVQTSLTERSQEAECDLLSVLLTFPEDVGEARETVDPSSFSSPALGQVYVVLVDLDRERVPFLLTDVVERVRASPGGSGVTVESLIRLQNRSVSRAHLAHVTGKVAGFARLRGVMGVAAMVADQAPRIAGTADAIDEFLEQMGQAFFAVAASGQRTAAVSLSEAFEEVFAQMKRAKESSGQTGIRSGIHGLDRSASLLNPGNLVILGARPRMGKSALAVQIAVHAATHEGHHFDGPAHAMVFSLEMSRAQLATRILSGAASVNSEYIIQGRASEIQERKLSEARAELRRVPVWLDTTQGLSVHAVCSRARRAKRAGELDLLVVDYIGLVKGDRYRDRHLEVGSVVRALKGLAMELDIPVLALAQLNRGLEQREDKTPKLSDLRESGDIEQDADVVIFLHRPCIYDIGASKTHAELTIAKNRSGHMGTLKLLFDAETTTFRNDEPDQATSWRA
jgi:replicative DNA helicase